MKKNLGIVKPFCDSGNTRYNIFVRIIARFDVSTLSIIWFDSRQFIIGSRKMNVNKREDKGTLLSAKRIFHTMATAATAKEPEIEQCSMLLRINGTNVDHMTYN
jgi:hypothetical protein